MRRSLALAACCVLWACGGGESTGSNGSTESSATSSTTTSSTVERVRITDALAATEGAEAPFVGLTEGRFAIADRCLRLVIADTSEERGRGLMETRSLSPYDGMLFVFPGDTITSFFMRDTLIALDIGFYAADGAPVDRAEMEPCPDEVQDCPLTTPSGPFRYAVETRRGELLDGALAGRA